MSKYLEFDTYQKGYKTTELSKANIKKNLGKTFCYLLSRDYDRNSGYMIARYATFTGVKYNSIIIGDYEDSIDFRDILELGIKIEENE